jgi:hypothetical protein
MRVNFTRKFIIFTQLCVGNYVLIHYTYYYYEFHYFSLSLSDFYKVSVLFWIKFISNNWNSSKKRWIFHRFAMNFGKNYFDMKFIKFFSDIFNWCAHKLNQNQSISCSNGFITTWMWYAIFLWTHFQSI